MQTKTEYREKSAFQGTIHRPRRKMSKRAERREQRAADSLMADAYYRMCRMEGGR